MMDEKDFHLLNFDSKELDRQIEIRQQLYERMVGTLYRGIIWGQIEKLLAIRHPK